MLKLKNIQPQSRQQLTEKYDRQAIQHVNVTTPGICNQHYAQFSALIDPAQS